MEIRQFAERVLFTDSLEEKLSGIDALTLTDDEPGSAILHPEAPGRPVHLQMRRGGGQAPFPAAHRLMDEQQRGVLLHFLANHELLATELMALVLLKFPEAPKAFRRGIVRTLQEEQRHTGWYLKRMGECGVEFGDLTLNRFFWDAVAPMETPLDYVTRLSLTFEQANLDYARHYSKLLREAGDSKTAALLEDIYRDEIAHVGYGLSWFRRWKADGETDWEAYRRQLHFPLSPSRARGNVPFNTEGRARAGFTEEFIREIAHFEQSKGRTPNVFWFNPNAEAAIAAQRAGIKFHPRVAVAALARDLEILPAFLSRRDDVLLMSDPPSIEERARLRQFGFTLPEIERLDTNGAIFKESALCNRKLNDLRPWAWSPESAALFAPLIGNCPGGQRKLDQFWNKKRAEIFSKKWALERRRELLESGLCPELITSEIAGRACESIEEVDEAVTAIRDGGLAAVALKAQFGMSGQKNRRLLADEPLSESVRRWAQRMIDTQGALIVEPWLERVHDFSIQYEMNDNRLTLIAPIHLFNDIRGQFLACECRPRFGQSLPTDVARFLMNSKSAGGSLLRLYDGAIRAILESGLRAAGYNNGPVGMDAFVYQGTNGDLRLQPIVEVNPRYTMGRLTFELMRQVAPRCSVRFELFNAARVQQAGCQTLQEYAEMLACTAPPQLDAWGRLCGGALILNQASKAVQALAVLTVRPFNRA